MSTTESMFKRGQLANISDSRRVEPAVFQSHFRNRSRFNVWGQPTTQCGGKCVVSARLRNLFPSRSVSVSVYREAKRCGGVIAFRRHGNRHAILRCSNRAAAPSCGLTPGPPNAGDWPPALGFPPINGAMRGFIGWPTGGRFDVGPLGGRGVGVGSPGTAGPPGAIPGCAAPPDSTNCIVVFAGRVPAARPESESQRERLVLLECWALWARWPERSWWVIEVE